jgi:hypothetical protein
MSVLVCIPTDRDIHSETAEAALAICANHAGGASFRTMRAHPVDRCRNLCVREFLQSPHSHLLFIDSDIVPPTNCLDAMLAAGREVVCGVYPLQLEGHLCSSVARKLAPNTYGFLNDFPDEPFEVDAAGMGCCLIARSLLERMQPPWFLFQVRPDHHQTGEDIFFFEKCAELGVRALVLPQLLCAHHRTLNLLEAFQEVRALRRQSRAPKQAA